MSLNPIELFAPYSARLEQFASRHNLQIEKYKHDVAQWSFFFEHPLGGYGRVDVQVSDKKEVFVQKVWTLYDYDQLTRYCKSVEPFCVANANVTLEEILLQSIKEILEWEVNELKFDQTFASGPWSDPRNQPKFPKAIV